MVKMIVKLELLFRLKSGEDLIPIFVLEKHLKYSENNTIWSKEGEIRGAESWAVWNR